MALRITDRRFFLAGAIGAWASGAAAAAARPTVITILGDSITAGYGLEAAEALPAQLKAALRRLGVDAEVRGAGVSGDTTEGGLARLDFSVQADTSLCVVALGGNDLLQGVAQSQALNQRDGIHPNPKGVKIIAASLAPVIARALRGAA